MSKIPLNMELAGAALAVCSSLLCGLSHGAGTGDNAAALAEAVERLRPLHMKISKPGPSDWLANHPERGQTFRQYLDSSPVKPSASRRIIYIQPIGTFTKEQRSIVALAAEFMGCFFNLPVKIVKDLPLSDIPRSARRRHPSWGMEQILTTYVLDDVLKPKLPTNAVAYIAFTASDLWPGEGWNFVFGEASLRDRVGVWSIYRNGDPAESAETFRLCLMRTMKTAVHETGHIFSMAHCTAYECCMCGSNHREESDRRPLWLCPECMAKVCWATGADPVERYRKLADFCGRNGFGREKEFYDKSIKVLTASP